MERRFANFRIAGRTLSGTALRYGDISPEFRERFEPRAFGDVPNTFPLNLQHDSSIVVVPQATLTDGQRELSVRADLPENSAALQLVRRGALRGFSIEFNAIEERHVGSIRVVSKAELVGLALVDEPAFPGSAAEVRAARGKLSRALYAIVSGVDVAEAAAMAEVDESEVRQALAVLGRPEPAVDGNVRTVPPLWMLS